jgi:hypothetical protein
LQPSPSLNGFNHLLDDPWMQNHACMERHDYAQAALAVNAMTPRCAKNRKGPAASLLQSICHMKV